MNRKEAHEELGKHGLLDNQASLASVREELAAMYEDATAKACSGVENATVFRGMAAGFNAAIKAVDRRTCNAGEV